MGDVTPANVAITAVLTMHFISLASMTTEYSVDESTWTSPPKRENPCSYLRHLTQQAHVF
jgi:hypothetical protein